MTLPEKVCVLLLILAVIWDVKRQRIPNFLTIPAALMGLTYHLWFEPDLGGFYFSAAGLVIGLMLLMIPFMLGGVGGGDIKLLGAAGAWLGPGSTCIFFLYGAIIGGLVAALTMVRHRSRNGFKDIRTNIVNILLTRECVSTSPEGVVFPYSIPLASGFFLYLILRDAGLFS